MAATNVSRQEKSTLDAYARMERKKKKGVERNNVDLATIIKTFDREDLRVLRTHTIFVRTYT